MHKNQHKMSNGLDNPKYQLAIELRLLGFTYAQIASNPQVGLKENTIRTWFVKEGVCYFPYKRLQKERQNEYKQIFDKLHLQMREMAIDAVRVLGEAVKKGNLKASIKVLELVDIQRYIYYQTGYEDEGVALLREIIKDRREARNLQKK